MATGRAISEIRRILSLAHVRQSEEMVTIAYALEPRLQAEEFVDVLRRSTLAARRPVDDAPIGPGRGRRLSAAGYRSGVNQANAYRGWPSHEPHSASGAAGGDVLSAYRNAAPRFMLANREG